jgi:hypothetical protein
MIIISPYSHVLPNGAKNPKNYPHWQSVVNQLVGNGKKVVQIGTTHEVPLSGVEVRFGKKWVELMQMVQECDTWASVDNFFPHLCSHTKRPGVVVWSRSDPRIFGYPTNANLLKDRSYLRPDPFGRWPACAYLEEAFLGPEAVANAILTQCGLVLA